MCGYLYIHERPPPSKEELSIPGMRPKYTVPQYGTLQRSTLSLFKNAQSVASEPVQVVSLEGCSVTEVRVKHGAFDRANYLRIFHPTRSLLSTSASARTLYIWCDVGYELERWYHALCAGVACARGEDPDTSYIAHFAGASQVCTALKAVSDPIGALNALTHRVWWTLHKEKLIETLVINEITQVISRAPLPPVIKYLKVDKIEFGANVPFVTDAALSNFSSKGELSVDCSVDYKGGAMITLSCCISVPVPSVGRIVSSIASASSQFIGSAGVGSGSGSGSGDGEKCITAALRVIVDVKRFTGQLRVMCLAPPSRTIWIGFHEEPLIEFAFDTAFDGSAAATSSLISSRIPKVTEAIASVVRTEIADILVLPQMDNIEIPDIAKLVSGDSSSSSSSSTLPPPLPPKSVAPAASAVPPPKVPPKEKEEEEEEMPLVETPPRPPKVSTDASGSASTSGNTDEELFDVMFPSVPRHRKPTSQQKEL